MKITDDINEFKTLSNDQIDWRSVGADNRNISSNKLRKTENKLGFQIAQPQKCCLKTQGPLVVSWPGNFFDADSTDGIIRVLYTNGNRNGGPIKIVFNKPVKGVGAQIQEHYGINPGEVNAHFRAVLRGFNGAIEIASTPPQMGTSDNGTTQAIFLGAYDAVANIDSIEFHTFPIHNDDDGEFAIGTVYLIV